MRCSCRRRSHLSFVRKRILLLQEQMMAPFQFAGFFFFFFNTIPLRNRSDFKQALSTLERLQQEAGQEPYVPTCSYKHKQRQLTQSSSSTWWNWQDSWWSSSSSESQGGGKQSLENERGDPLLIVLWCKPPKMALKNSIHFVADGS